MIWHRHSWEMWAEPVLLPKRTYPSSLERLTRPDLKPWDSTTEAQRRRCKTCGVVEWREVPQKMLPA